MCKRERERASERNTIAITSARNSAAISRSRLRRNNTNLVLLVAVFRLVRKRRQNKQSDGSANTLITRYSCSLSPLGERTRAGGALLPPRANEQGEQLASTLALLIRVKTQTPLRPIGSPVSDAALAASTSFQTAAKQISCMTGSCKLASSFCGAAVKHRQRPLVVVAVSVLSPGLVWDFVPELWGTLVRLVPAGAAGPSQVFKRLRWARR